MKLLDEYILYIDEKIDKDERLFLDLKSYSSHIDEECSIEEQKLSLCSELLSFSENILSFYNEENISSSFKKLIAEHKYEEAFDLMMHEYKYAYIEIKNYFILYKEKLNRKLVVPLRYYMDEVCIAILSSYRSDMCHYFLAYTKQTGGLSTLLEVVNENKNNSKRTLDNISL